MNLITEYQKRHNKNFIPVCHDGVCFFNVGKHPALVALTSLACRSWSTCLECNTDSPNVIVEFFMPGYNGSFIPGSHVHVDPCTDLMKVIEDKELTDHKPYYAKSVRDLEIWLWKFCTKDSRFRTKLVEDDPELKTIEQMVHCAQKNLKLYQAYYITLEAFLPQRKYLLFE